MLDGPEAFAKLCKGLMKKSGKYEQASLNLEARKGLWRLGIKNGNGPRSDEGAVVIESLSHPEGKWPQACEVRG